MAGGARISSISIFTGPLGYLSLVKHLAIRRNFTKGERDGSRLMPPTRLFSDVAAKENGFIKKLNKCR